MDAVVTNPDAQTSRLAAGYTFASAASFDFNGTWWGSDSADNSVEFTIESNGLTRISCNSVSDSDVLTSGAGQERRVFFFSR